LPWQQRIVLIWIIEAVTFGLLIVLLRGISFEVASVAVATAIAVGLANSLLRPIMVRFRITLSLPIFSLLALGLNILLVWLATEYAPGLTLSQIWLIPLISAVVAAVNVSFSDLFAIDDDDSYYQHLLSRMVGLQQSDQADKSPGVIFLEIDGLSERILQRAIGEGFMPALARWQQEGSHRITGWECNVPCQTSASQAGILLGSNYDIPAFRWYEKERGRTMVSNRPSDAAELEHRLSKGIGLLARGGASRANLVSGDAPMAMFTFSTLTDATRHSTQDFYPLFIGPYNVLRIVLLFLWDVFAELRAASYQRRQDERPRIHRGGVYPLLRAATTVVMRELSAYILIGDMYTGVPAVYTTFFGYDEVAHHSGIERPDVFPVLRDLDGLFHRLERVAKRTPRSYQFVILSDHGQSQGATFKQRYEMTLEELVRSLVSDRQMVEGVDSEDAAWGNVGVILTDFLNDVIPGDNRLIARLLRRSVRDRIYVDKEKLSSASVPSEPAELEHEARSWSGEGIEAQLTKIDQALDTYREKFEKQREYVEQVIVGPYRKLVDRAEQLSEAKQPEVIVLASGNLGLVYFTQWQERLSYELINETFPDLLPGLTGHEGIGFVLVHSDEHGPLVIGPGGIHYLNDDRVEGEDPLTNFGRHAADHMQRLDTFPHVADIMVNSLYEPETGEVAAFEELVGSHGGLGGDQMSPFLMYPAEWKLEKSEIIGTSDLHAQLTQWLDQFSEA
jgi:putative membrane protein